ncbi:hypothetical protein LLEC1_04628 [Akanthomyces lecanii]|uniref:CFEM domain-containing protein n=1 Tax=Cordyceps confragosa TaxID=2714763 RepID=A0A179IFK3_CORDF|nr:hypothetical protein LLEC1_04628 [Akanthomyces lecanii]
MRFLYSVSTVLAASMLQGAAVAAAQQSSGLSLTDAISQMPSCALSCLLKVVGDTGCSPTNRTCICETNYHEIETTASPCILKACSFADALQARNLTALSCDAPIRDKTMRYNTMAIVLGVVTNLLVIVRLVFKRFFSYRQSLGWDDHTIVAALLVGVPATALNVVGLTASGMGRDPAAQAAAALEKKDWRDFDVLARVTVVSILRLQSLIYLARSFNPTWDQWIVAWWSTIEVHVGMVCASLPTLRLVLVRLCPRVFSTNISRNKSFTERNTRPNSSTYIMQSKEVTLSEIEIELGATSSPGARRTIFPALSTPLSR